MNRLLSGVGILLVLGAGNAVAQNIFPPTGNVGIGTTSPGSILSVANSGTSGINFASFLQPNLSMGQFNSIALGQNMSYYNCGALQFTYVGAGSSHNFTSLGNCAADQTLNVLANGNVGIGTTNPLQTLHLYNTSGATWMDLSVQGSPGGNTGIAFRPWDSGSSMTDQAEIYAHDDGNYGANMHFLFKTDGGPTNPLSEKMTILGNSGYVGIGTTTPRSALDINGNVTFSDGTVQATAWNGTTLGGDYAESIDVLGDRAGYEPGDVIVIDDSVTGKFNKSDKSYSKLVAGVYSTKPGLVGRRVTADRPDKATEVPMAMMGIVPTKVTTENGSIERGDLLVSSSTPGYAMKGTDRDRLTGAVIGKALAPLKSGSGVVEVLLALQ